MVEAGSGLEQITDGRARAIATNPTVRRCCCQFVSRESRFAILWRFGVLHPYAMILKAPILNLPPAHYFEPTPADSHLSSVASPAPRATAI